MTKHLHNRMPTFLFIPLLAFCPAVASAQQTTIWTQYWDVQSQISDSSVTPDGTNSEVADDFDLAGSITAIRADGSHITYFNSPPMNLQGAYVRFYEGHAGVPGTIQYEQFVPASAITLTTDVTGGFMMHIPLPEQFTASGRHFVSVQTVSDLGWSWRTANTSDVLLATAKQRNRAAGTAWTSPTQTDVAFVLYGTLTSPPNVSSIPETSVQRSGRLRLRGTSFGTAQGASEVRIGGVKAIVTRWTNTKIHAYVPEALQPGTHDVQVLTANGSSATVPLNVIDRTAPGGQALWRFQADSIGVSAKPVVAPDGTIYVMDDNGNLYALNPGGGLIWATKSGFQGSRLTRGDDGTLYTMADGVLQATNPDGTPKWTFTHPNLNWTISGPTVGPDGNVYAVSQNSGFGFFSVTPQGALRWANPFVLDRVPRGHEIVFSHGQAYINHRRDDMPNLELMAFGMENGDFRWIKEAHNGSQPLIGPGGRIYVDWLTGVWSTRVYNPDGSLHQSREGTLGMRTFSPDRTKIHANLPSTQHISALNSQTFDVLWTAETGVPLVAPPTADPFDRYIVARTHRPGSPGNLFTFASSGHLLWREDLPVENGGMIMPTGGPVFSNDGNTFYTGTVIPGQDANNEYSYVYAFALPPQTPLRAPISIGAVSRKTHGSGGTFDVELPFTGAAGIEPRSGGANGNHQVVVSFATAISMNGAAITDGSGSVSSHSVDGSKAILTLTGVANAATTTITLNGVNDGLTLGPVSVRLSTLLGDTNGNGIVNASDVGKTKADASQQINSSNFRSDVTANGTINASDIGQVKAHSGTRLP